MNGDRRQNRAAKLEEMLRLMCEGRTEGMGDRTFSDKPDRHPADQRWVELNAGLNPSWRDHHCQGSDCSGAVEGGRRGRPGGRVGVLEPALSYMGGQSGVAIVVMVASVFILCVMDVRQNLHKADLASMSVFEEDLASRYRDRGGGNGAAMQRGIGTLLMARGRGWLSGTVESELVASALAEFTYSFFDSHDPFQRAESAFLAAKANLMLDDVAGTCRWLDRVLAQRVEDYRVETGEMLREICRAPPNLDH